MVMVPYVQRAIQERKQADPGVDLWLFPGMELTASGGKQCLIIFDADLSESWREQAQGKLGIAYTNLDKLSAAGPRVTQLTCPYPDIARLLDDLEDLRGKYIVLPNVSQGKQPYGADRRRPRRFPAHALCRRLSRPGADDRHAQPKKTRHVCPGPTRLGRFDRFIRFRPPTAVQRTSRTSVRTTPGSNSPSRRPKRSGKPFSATVHASALSRPKSRRSLSPRPRSKARRSFKPRHWPSVPSSMLSSAVVGAARVRS